MVRGPQNGGHKSRHEAAQDLDAVAAVLRKEVERTAIHTPTIFSLPLAREIRLKTVPGFAGSGEAKCESKARWEWEPPGGYYRPTIVQRWELHCGLPADHAGPHCGPHEGPHFSRRALVLTSLFDQNLGLSDDSRRAVYDGHSDPRPSVTAGSR